MKIENPITKPAVFLVLLCITLGVISMLYSTPKIVELPPGTNLYNLVNPGYTEDNITVGKCYYFKSSDPFDKRIPRVYKVLEIKEGYVRYRYLDVDTDRSNSLLWLSIDTEIACPQ